MSFRGIDISATYNTGYNRADLVEKFYTPVLEQTLRYDRVAGYFSSKSLASSARGVAGLIRNGGKMRLITSHAFTPSDTSTLKNFYDDFEFSNSLIEEFRTSYEELGNLSSTIAKSHVQAMCWMLREEILEIRVVVPASADLSALMPEDFEKFHPKYGNLFDRDGNIISFSGSINETESAWTRNMENLHVYASWISDELGRRIQPQIEDFERLWEGRISTEWRTIPLPEAVKKKIVAEYAPSDFPQELIREKKQKNNALRNYQSAAVDSWVQANRRGILVMATGTGKTRTARACIESTLELGTLLTIVVVPYRHIGDQWLKELSDLDPSIVGSNRRSALAKLKTDLVLSRINQLTLIVVKDTAGKPDFKESLIDLSQQVDNVLLIGDEVHWLGATAYQGILDEFANFRLGLSATPARYFDEVGTDLLMDYFGGPVFELPIKEALKIKDEQGNAILCPYEYHPIIVNLNEFELEEYRELTKRIGRFKNMEADYDVQKQLETLYRERAKISKNAEAKIPAFRSLLMKLGNSITHCLIYCSDEKQLFDAAVVLQELRITAQQITGDESTTPSPRWNGMNEREYIIDNFSRGKVGVLLAIRCLDEGVDIPAAKMGIILASSGNTKEFIQRRGRLMRPFLGKSEACIYDLCVLPTNDDTWGVENLVLTELRRIREYSEDAINATEVDNLLDRYEQLGGKNG